MRIVLTIDGGFAYVPALRRPVVVDDAQLSVADAAELHRLCTTALDGPNRPPPPPASPSADARRYRLAIEIDGTTNELTAADPVASPAVARLIEFLEARRAR